MKIQWHDVKNLLNSRRLLMMIMFQKLVQVIIIIIIIIIIVGFVSTYKDDQQTLQCYACLVPQLFARYSFQPNHRLGLDAWFCAEVVYPSKDGHPPRH